MGDDDLRLTLLKRCLVAGDAGKDALCVVLNSFADESYHGLLPHDRVQENPSLRGFVGSGRINQQSWIYSAAKNGVRGVMNTKLLLLPYAMSVMLSFMTEHH